MTAPREIPILYTGEMVRAILDERKTQTRRVVTLDVPGDAEDVFAWFPPNPPRPGEEYAPGGLWARNPSGLLYLGRCPYGQPGDLLYVREAHSFAVHRSARPDMVWYRADGEHQHGKQLPLSYVERERRWRPSIHMPKWASRIWLEVTDVRVERVQEIKNADCLAEGIPTHPVYGSPTSYREQFARLWDSINADRGYGWSENPYVWVVSFRRAER